jgi:hypothetical protein
VQTLAGNDTVSVVSGVETRIIPVVDLGLMSKRSCRESVSLICRHFVP